MMARPKCANPKCENDGWICVGQNFYCSDCVCRWDKRRKEKLMEEMEDGIKDLP